MDPEKRPCDHRGGGRGVRSHPSWEEEAQTGLPWGLGGEHGPAHTLTSDPGPQSWERTHF